MRIVKVIPYYGSWPVFMHPYLESCRRNPMLSVTFVTELPPFPRSPPNVRYFHLSFADLRARIERLFGLCLPGLIPYKLCDLRPAFGVIFADVIGDADFWGYGDNDMLLGNVSAFLTRERLEAHDVLSFKKGHLHGPFSLYRNTPRINDLFRDGGEYERVFTTPGYISFDEFGPNCFYTKMSRPEDVLGFPSDNISVIAFKRALAGELRVYNEQQVKEGLHHGDLLAYQDGRVVDVRTGRDYLFYHWVLEKRALWFQYPRWFQDRPTRFYVSTTGFYSTREYAAYPALHASRLLRGAVRWAGLKGANYVRRRLGRPVTLDTRPKVGGVKRLDAG